MAFTVDDLPDWVTWQQRPFLEANLLLVRGREPALIDPRRTQARLGRSGEVGC